MKLSRILRHKFVRDTATLQAGTLFVLVGNLGSAVLLAHVLGARAQGQYYVAITLYSLLWFVLNPGLVAATVTQVAAARVRGLHDKAEAWLAFLAKAQFLLGLALVLLGLAARPVFARLSAPGDSETAEFCARWALVLTATPLLELPRVVLVAALQATRSMTVLARVEMGNEIVRVFLVITLALVTGSAAGALLGTLIASALGGWIAWEHYQFARAQPGSDLPSLRAIAARVREVPLRDGLRLSFKLGICRSMDAVANQLLPTLLLQRYASAEWVAYVRLAQRLVTLPQIFMQALGRTLMPRLSELAGEQNRERFRATFVRGSLASGAIVCAALAVLLAGLPWLVEHAFPPDYRAPILRVAWILAPGMALLSFSIANETFYLVTGQLRVLILSCVLGLALAGVAQLTLARALPETGVAWGLSITSAWSLAHYAYFTWYWRRERRSRR